MAQNKLYIQYKLPVDGLNVQSNILETDYKKALQLKNVLTADDGLNSRSGFTSVIVSPKTLNR